jgi:hypothetical protein
MSKPIGRTLVLALVGIAALLFGQAIAYACYTDYIPASTPGGIGASMTFSAAMPTEPYAPSTTEVSGPNTCILLYHQYFGTPGCGGFSVDVTFDNVEAQPGYIAGTVDPTVFYAYADTARTFGCRTADGDFDWNTAFVVSTTDTQLSAVYQTTQAGYLIYLLQQLGGNDGPSFYVNFAPVTVNCPVGETPSQFGLMVSNLSITIADSPVYGTQTWNYPGPFYG